MKTSDTFIRDNYASAAGERKDCAVRSFSVAACVSYEFASKLFEKHGRKHNKGTSFTVSDSVIKEEFPNHVFVGAEGLTLPNFAKRYNKGHYIVHVRKHALAIVDGVIHDWRPRPKTKVWCAWRLDT